MNLSYCRFRNTSSDLEECVDAIEEVSFIEELDLTPEEMAAFKRMIVLCESFVERATELLGDDVEWEV